MLTTSRPTRVASLLSSRYEHGDMVAERSLEMDDSMLVGESEAMQRLRMQVRLLGPHFRIVLLQGEPGTGKELTARALHGYSSHAAGPFVRLECSRNEAAEGLMDALKAAHRGTVYLPEIDAMRRDAQGRLLAVLQGRDRVLPRPIVVHGLEARIIASATGDLRLAVADGRFLHELYRRISSVTIELTPLRERVEDVPVLAQYFLEGLRLGHGKDLQELQQSILSRWIDHSWPNNVEELKQLMQQAVEASPNAGREPQPMARTDREAVHEPVTVATGTMRLQEVVEQHILQVLKECSGNKVRAAEVLGISRSTLYRMLDGGLERDKLAGLR